LSDTRCALVLALQRRTQECTAPRRQATALISLGTTPAHCVPLRHSRVAQSHWIGLGHLLYHAPFGKRRWLITFLKYLLMSGVSLGINLGLTALLHELGGIREEFAFAISIGVVLVTNFLGLRYFVFPGQRGRIVGQFVLFVLSCSGFRASEYAAFLALHTWMGMAYPVSIFLILLASFLMKFFYYGAVIFSKPASGLATSQRVVASIEGDSC
jgi:putative flippase GtrA